jgi:hypothetical protein
MTGFVKQAMQAAEAPAGGAPTAPGGTGLGRTPGLPGPIIQIGPAGTPGIGGGTHATAMFRAAAGGGGLHSAGVEQQATGGPARPEAILKQPFASFEGQIKFKAGPQAAEMDFGATKKVNRKRNIIIFLITSSLAYLVR